MKDVKGKLRLGLLPPEFKVELAQILMFGAEKYKERDWEKGGDYNKYFEACQRHLLRWELGEDVAKDSGLHHLIHAICSLVFLYTFEKRGIGNNDMPVISNADNILKMLNEMEYGNKSKTENDTIPVGIYNKALKEYLTKDEYKNVERACVIKKIEVGDLIETAVKRITEDINEDIMEEVYSISLGIVKTKEGGIQ